MSKESTKKIGTAGVRGLGVMSGMFLAALINRLLAAKVPVPFWLLNAAVGAGVVYLSTTQKDETAHFAEGFGIGHFSVGAFQGLKSLSVPGIPTINGMKGLPPINEQYSLPEGAAMYGIGDDSAFVGMIGPIDEETANAKATFSMF